MSTGTVSYLNSPRNSLSVVDSLYKIMVETGGGLFAGVCHSAGLVTWRSPASGTLLYCPIDLLSAERVRKTTLDSDSLTAVTQVAQ
jgi:hypothetical protein